MADSLFDNRYRYNYIYPRGRSGETLRATDTMNDERPVVIKRPAPNDAPPIRAGQEVSIINEREALTRLAGHPILTELLGAGQFFVGGIPHQYIVMERAEGIIVEEEVVRLAALNQRLPELEMLEIIDRLIHLLSAAHDKDIVYNDVDAKHLFWNRDTYTLKVIDWGNAVFLEGDEVTSQGISRQTDVYQIGELLYFILSGGYRVDVPRDAGADFRVDFHQDQDNVEPRLREIVSKAVHPNLRLRYSSLKALNADLSHYRSPLEQVRNAIVSRTITRLNNPNLSRNELLGLQTQLESALRQNPAYPVARNTHKEIVDRLRDLEVSADLDAAAIYMGNENWSRAGDLLNDLRERAGSKTSGIIHLMLDWCLLLIDAQLESTPAAITEAINLLFEYKPDKAASALMLDEAASAALHWRMAERISSHFPDILLLQPNLNRLENAVDHIGADNIPIHEATTILQSINRALDRTANMAKPSAADLRDIYGEVVDSISSLNANLQTLSLQHEFSESRLPLNALTRALNAAMALADNMHVIGKQAANNPRDALSALDASRAIDPRNPVWDQIEDFLSLLYEVLQTSQTYVPAVDGSDLAQWLEDKYEELAPFAKHLFDEMLIEMLDNLKKTAAAWTSYREVVVAGNKTEAVNALALAAERVATLSPTLSSWFNQLRTIIDGAEYVERHSVPGHLGRTLADGWSAFDNGQLADAERLGQQAMEIARDDNEGAIAERLWRLSHVLREWVERNGVESDSRTQQSLLEIEKLFTEAENSAVSNFAGQMPSTETYLKAMGQGLVQAFGNSCTAALRILFAQYILSGVLDAHDGLIDDARFWRAAALRALPETAERQPALAKLDDYIERRTALLGAQNQLNGVNGKVALGAIDELVRQLENNDQERLLAPAVHSLRTLEAAVQDWAGAEFRAAGGKIDQALRAITETESNANISLADYRSWLVKLQEALAELSVKRRNMLQEIDRLPDEPREIIREVLRLQVDATEDLIGAAHTQMLGVWRDTYEQFLEIYTSDALPSQKTEAMNEGFKALFIERNPAYPLFRHWWRRLEDMPDDVVTSAESANAGPAEEASESDDEREPLSDSAAIPAKHRSPMSRLLFRVGALVGLILVIGGLFSLAADDNFSSLLAVFAPSPTATPKPTATALPTKLPASADVDSDDADDESPDASEANLAPLVIDAAAADVSEKPEMVEATVEPAATEPPPPTKTPEPTATDLPTLTPTPEDTPTPTATATPALPPEGLTGEQNLLKLYGSSLTAPFWNERQFRSVDGSWRVGVSSNTEGDTIQVSPPADLLEKMYGNSAPGRVSRVEADLTLRSFNPAVVSGDDVYFGIILQSQSGDKSAGIQVQAVGPNVINLARVQDGEANFVSQRSVNAVIVRLRLEFDRENDVVFAYYNDSQIGSAVPLDAPDDQVLPVIFAKDGGVIIGVSSWRITLE